MFVLKQKLSWVVLVVLCGLASTTFIPKHTFAQGVTYHFQDINTIIQDSGDTTSQFNYAGDFPNSGGSRDYQGPGSGSCPPIIAISLSITELQDAVDNNTPVSAQLVQRIDLHDPATGVPPIGTCEDNSSTSVSVTNAQVIDNPQDPNDPNGEDEPTVPTCESQGGGLGWIACPLITGMLGALQGLTNFMSSLLELRPITTSDPIFIVWTNVRNIALGVLVIAAIIAIFGQTLGIDAYTVKKMVPRIGIGALLILLSFYISAILIDFFNVLGNGMQDLMFSATEGLTIQTGFGSEWAAGLLGAIGVGGVAVLILNPATLATLGLILLPVVLSFLAALATVILRQIVIISLVVVSPLAFAAWILPTTDKWFKRWYGIFTTMLLMYPLIMVLLGSAAIYAVIVTNGGGLSTSDGINSNNFINYLLAIVGIGIAMAMIPFTIRASSGILKGAVGALNNPNRGIIDRARKGMEGAKQRNMDQRKQDRLAGLRDGKTTSGKEFKKFSPTRALYRASTGTMGKFTGGGKYAELHQEQQEGEALSTEQQMARAKNKKLRIPLEDLRVELEGSQIEIQKKGLRDQQRSQEIGSIMANYANPQPIDPDDPSSGKRAPLSPTELESIATSNLSSDIERIGATLRLTQMRQDESMGKALSSMPGWMAAETVNRDFGTFSEFAPHLTSYATGKAVSGGSLAEKVMNKGYHQVGGLGSEAVKVVAETAAPSSSTGVRDITQITQLANRYIEAYDKNQQLSPAGVTELAKQIEKIPGMDSSIKDRVYQIAGYTPGRGGGGGSGSGGGGSGSGPTSSGPASGGPTPMPTPTPIPTPTPPNPEGGYGSSGYGPIQPPNPEGGYGDEPYEPAPPQNVHGRNLPEATTPPDRSKFDRKSAGIDDRINPGDSTGPVE